MRNSRAVTVGAVLVVGLLAAGAKAAPEKTAAGTAGRRRPR